MSANSPGMPAMPAKKDVLLALLERSSVFVHLDPRPDTVRVPPWFKKQPQLVLQIGLNMAVPIRDLTVDDEAVSGTLSFSRTPHFCYMPWSAVFALVGEDSRGMVWPENIPPEVVAQRAKAQPSAASKPKLHAVKDGEREPLGTTRSEARSEQRPAAEGPAPPPKGEAQPPNADRDEAADQARHSAPPQGERPQPKKRPSHLRLVK